MPYKDKAAQREYQREWVARRRAAFFNGKSCVNCGSIDNLELDHIDRSTRVTHRVWTWTEKRRLAELQKCQILCRACHIEKTKEDMGYELVHGTQGGYRTYGCRCELCVKNFRDKQNEWRWRTGRRRKQYPKLQIVDILVPDR